MTTDMTNALLATPSKSRVLPFLLGVSLASVLFGGAAYYHQAELALMAEKANRHSTMHLVSGRSTECGWEGEDQRAQVTLGGGGHSLADCLETCRASDSCKFAAFSEKGYCHLFATCDGHGPEAVWTVHEKLTVVTTDWGRCEDKGYKTIVSEQVCRKAAQLAGGYDADHVSSRYDDIVDGCSRRTEHHGGTTLFFGNQGNCDRGHDAHDWSFSGCDCGKHNDCLCLVD